MQKRKRFLALACAAALLLLAPFSVFASGAPQPAAAAEPAEFSFLVKDYGRDKITDDLFVFKVWEEKLGIKIHPVPILESDPPARPEARCTSSGPGRSRVIGRGSEREWSH